MSIYNQYIIQMYKHILIIDKFSVNKYNRRYLLTLLYLFKSIQTSFRKILFFTRNIQQTLKDIKKI